MCKLVELTEFVTNRKIFYNLGKAVKIFRDSEVGCTRIQFDNGTTEFVMETVSEIQLMLSYGD